MQKPEQLNTNGMSVSLSLTGFVIYHSNHFFYSHIVV